MKKKKQSVLAAGLDQRRAALIAARQAALRPARGWIRAVRTAGGLSQARVAKTLGVAQQAVAGLEQAEEREAITLQSLRRVAEAMECDLVYFLVPKTEGSYAALAERQDPKMKHLRATEHSMALENQAVGDLEKS